MEIYDEKMRIRVGIVASVLLAGAAAPSQVRQSNTSNRVNELLKAYLRNYLSPSVNVVPDTTTRITVFNVKTNDGTTEEDIVYIVGQDWCGSGGCTMLIVESTQSVFKVLADVSIVQLPIRLLPSLKYGHPDIGVMVRGGGIQPGYEAVLSFDGKSYPRNPSVKPARKIIGVRGRVIIANTDDSVPLYE